jgi:hypothetical protein
VTPSGEVTTMLPEPMAANSGLDEAMALRLRAVFELRTIQFTMSGEVRMVPPPPTAT